jgi:multiple sugar transport system ATP-binding protein
VFVAGFIGSPDMNIFKGEAAQFYNTPIVGVRPENIRLSKEGGTWKSIVGVAENLGSDTFLHVNVNGLGTVTVRASGDLPVDHGDTVFLSPDAVRVHRFDDRGFALR